LGLSFEILNPHRGQKSELIQLATEKATETLNALQARWRAEKHRQTEALFELQTALKLFNPTNRIVIILPMAISLVGNVYLEITIKAKG
jgi:excinuclease UvrABC nuclease subunit